MLIMDRFTGTHTRFTWPWHAISWSLISLMMRIQKHHWFGHTDRPDVAGDVFYTPMLSELTIYMQYYPTCKLNYRSQYRVSCKNVNAHEILYTAIVLLLQLLSWLPPLLITKSSALTSLIQIFFIVLFVFIVSEVYKHCMQVKQFHYKRNE